MVMPEVRTPQVHQHGLNLALLHATPSAVTTLNADGRITFLNAAAERLLSVEEQGAAGRPYTEVFGPSLASRMVGLFQQGMGAQDLCWLVRSSARSETPRPPHRGSLSTARRDPVSKALAPAFERG